MRYRNNKLPSLVPSLRVRGKLWNIPDPKLERALSRNTPKRRAKYERELYDHAMNYLRWCTKNRVTPLPADDRDVYKHLDDLANSKGRPIPYLRRRLTAINALHISNGFSRSSSILIAAFLRSRARKHVVLRRTPLKPEEIQAMCDLAYEIHSPLRAARDVSILTFAFCSAERSSEILELSVSDFKIDEHGIVHLIPRSKSNPNGERIELQQISRLPAPWHCPAEALNRWITLADIRSGRVFRCISRTGKVLDRPLGYEAYRKILGEYVAKLGLNGRFGAYSTRRGWATYAQRRLSKGAIKTYLRHSDERTTAIYIDPLPLPWDRVPTAAAFV